MKNILLLCILSTCIACLPDSKDLGCRSLESIVEVEKKYITQASKQWFTNNIDLKDYQIVFFESIAVDAVVLDDKYGIPAEVTIAQAILESGWGQSELSKKANNYFGVKEYRKTKKGGKFETTEYLKGKKVVKIENFRVYDNVEHCLQDRAYWLYNNKRYQDVNWHTLNAFEFCEILQDKKYATDPNYSKKLKRIINSYKLTQFTLWLKMNC